MLSPKNNNPKKRGNRFIFQWITAGLSILLLIYVIHGIARTQAQEISWSEFESKILALHAVDSINVIDNEKAEIYIDKTFADYPYFKSITKPDGKHFFPGPHYTVRIGSPEQLQKKLDEYQQQLPAAQHISLNFEKRERPFGGILAWLIPLVLIFIWLRVLSKNTDPYGIGGSSAFTFGRSTAVLQTNDQISNVTFKDVAGLEEARQEVSEIVDFLQSPATYTQLGAKIPRGVILIGPPGTGKTLLARAVAGEAGVPFFSLSGSEFVEMFVGVGASRVRDLFRQAKEKAPAIIFIDEIDAVGRSRGRNAFYSGANDERESTLNQLLTEMDGFGTNSGVIVLAATNRADMLDPALLRPGRFDRHIYLELPSLPEREAIFIVHMKHLKLGADADDPAFLASQTPGFSGADIANICNEAALFAARRKSTGVEKCDFLDAIDRIVAGPEKKSKIISSTEKKIIAYHEAGHALVSWILKNVDPLIKVSIIPRGKSLGAAWYLPEEHQLRSAAACKDELSAGLAGRAAEETVFNEISSGALDDLEKVTKEAYRMVAFYGFDTTIGNISFFDSSGQTDNPFQKPYSEETAKLIDQEVRTLITEAYNIALDLLKTHRSQLNRLAEILLEKEVIFREDLESILGKRD